MVFSAFARALLASKPAAASVQLEKPATLRDHPAKRLPLKQDPKSTLAGQGAAQLETGQRNRTH
jgi:hypothetical protein